MATINPLEFDDYKEIIRLQWRRAKENDKKITLKYLAARLEVQHTYLSKFFNRPEVHLSDDNLFELAQALGFGDHDIEFILLLRGFEMSQNEQKKDFLQKRINKARQAYKVGEEIQSKGRLELEMEYLLDANFTIIHMALTLDKFERNPEKLADFFNLKLNELKKYYKTLDALGFIKLGEGPLEVEKVFTNKLHYGKTHPLTRIHQYVLKGKINDRLRYIPEKEKESFLATFSFDHASFLKAKEEFKIFFNKLADLQSKSRPEDLYQLSFDLFKWL